MWWIWVQEGEANHLLPYNSNWFTRWSTSSHRLKRTQHVQRVCKPKLYKQSSEHASSWARLGPYGSTLMQVYWLAWSLSGMPVSPWHNASSRPMEGSQASERTTHISLTAFCGSFLMTLSTPQENRKKREEAEKERQREQEGSWGRKRNEDFRSTAPRISCLRRGRREDGQGGKWRRKGRKERWGQKENRRERGGGGGRGSRGGQRRRRRRKKLS